MRIWSRETTARSSWLGGVGEVLVELLPARPAGLALAELGDDAGVDRRALLGDRGADAVDVEGDVDLVGDRLLVPVLHHEVLVEEPERLLVRRRGQADREGVEVVEHLPPEAVDRAVALVHDHHVERLRRDGRVVLDRHRLGRQLVGGVLVRLRVELRVAAQDRVDPLDRRDRHARDRVDLVRAQVLDVVELGELAAVVGRREPLELLQRLAAEVGAVDEEEDPPRVGVLDQPVADVGGGERLARPGRHLDQRPRPVRRQRLLEVRDRPELRRPQPRLLQLRQPAQPVAQRRRVRMAAELLEPAGERLGPVEREHRPARRLGVEPVREPRLGPGRLVDEREAALDRRLELVRQPVDVLRALVLDAGERLALLLRLHHARRAAVEEQQVVGAAVRPLHHELPHRHTPGGGEVHGPRVLHRPAGGLQHLVDPHPSATLRRHVRAAACDRRHVHIFPGLAGGGETGTSVGVFLCLESNADTARRRQ